jgi:hypothetical protein
MAMALAAVAVALVALVAMATQELVAQVQQTLSLAHLLLMPRAELGKVAELLAAPTLEKVAMAAQALVAQAVQA